LERSVLRRYSDGAGFDRLGESSWFEPFVVSTAGREQLIEIDGGVLGGIFEAQGNLRFTEAGLGWLAARGYPGVAQGAFDFGAEFAADALQAAGDAGFMFAKLSTNVS